MHRSGIKGSMYRVMKTFVCRGCMNPVTGMGCTSGDIGVNANLELVDKFCYLDDMLSVHGDADAAVETRINQSIKLLFQAARPIKHTLHTQKRYAHTHTHKLQTTTNYKLLTH